MAKLRDAARMQGQGATIPPVCKKLGVSEQTFYNWRQKYGVLKKDEAGPAQDPGEPPRDVRRL